MTKTVNHWIGGKTVEGTSGKYGPVTDPATGAVTTQVALASTEEVDAAVAAAKAAYTTWGTSSSPSAPRSSSATARCWTPTATTSPR